MNLLRPAILALLLPAGIPVQAADVGRIATDVRVAPPPARIAPSVAKTPAPSGPVPLPYPNVAPVQPKEKAPEVRAIKIDPVKLKAGTGNEPGTRKDIVAKPGGQGGAVLLNPLDSPRPRKADQLNDLGDTDQHRLQESMNKLNRAEKSSSQVMKKKQDSDGAISNNIK